MYYSQEFSQPFSVFLLWIARYRSAVYTFLLDVLWGQPIKLVQVAFNSELRKNQWNNLLFFEIVPSHYFGASEAFIN